MLSENQKEPEKSQQSEITPAMAAARLLGSRGGAARAKALSKQRRREIGKLGAAIRWGKAKAKAKR